MSKQVVVADEPDAQRDVEDENEDWPGEDISEAKEETEASEKKGKNGKKRRKKIFIGAAALLVVAIAGLAYWLYARQYESTDDAFIDGDITQVSPKVSAYVKKVDVSSNQFVHKGDLLVELDQSDLEVRLAQAKAAALKPPAASGPGQANNHLTEQTTAASQMQARIERSDH